MTKPQNIETKRHEKALILGIEAPYNPTKHIETYFEEFRNLVRTDQIDYDHELFIKLRSIDPAYFISKGKLTQIQEFCNQNNIQQIIVSEPLTSQQVRNLSEMLNGTILDRTDLILEIFQKAAHSAEGKTQVEIAFLQHQKTRLAGRGISFSQQAGMIGTRGPGETIKEKELRHLNQQIHKLKKELDKLQKIRETQRKRRLQSHEPFICLIGYTNSGKSTILNQLTKSDVLAEDKLFATLDTTTRQLYLDGTKKGLISDTVGFIQLLPHQLIEAFKSTLSELEYADLLLFIIDISDPNWEEHIGVVQDILDELEIEKDVLYVFNKIDKAKNFESYQNDIEKYKPNVVTSALSRDGLKELSDYLSQWKHEVKENQE